MTHDPLCYMAEGKWDGGCQCALIARVRADERINAVQECMETVNVIVWKYHNTHYHERAEVARECQRSLRAVQVMP